MKESLIYCAAECWGLFNFIHQASPPIYKPLLSILTSVHPTLTWTCLLFSLRELSLFKEHFLISSWWGFLILFELQFWALLHVCPPGFDYLLSPCFCVLFLFVDLFTWSWHHTDHKTSVLTTILLPDLDYEQRLNLRLYCICLPWKSRHLHYNSTWFKVNMGWFRLKVCALRN